MLGENLNKEIDINILLKVFDTHLWKGLGSLFNVKPLQIKQMRQVRNNKKIMKKIII
jgi:hypothetical protein